MAFCNMLAFWCGRDVELMDSIYRSSGLMRSKWDRKQSGSTYGMLTLQKAVSTCQDIYSPQNSSTYSISVGSKQSKRKSFILLTIQEMQNGSLIITVTVLNIAMLTNGGCIIVTVNGTMII